MFTPYHAILFAILLIGGAAVIFQTSEGDDSLTSIPKQSSDSRFDVKSY